MAAAGSSTLLGARRTDTISARIGAQGVWTGSIWLGVTEANTGELIKEKLWKAEARDAVRSRSLSGKPARLLRTAWTEAWERDDCPGTLPMPLQYMACSEAQMRIGLAARKPGKARELIGMPVGQVVGRMDGELTSAQVVLEFMQEFVEVVGRLDGMLEAAEKHG